jgi:hypothetical protein
MSDPIVDSSELGTYLGIADVSSALDRLSLVIGYAQTLCESVVSPLPVGAEVVVVDVVTRAFTNPGNARSQGTGPYSVNWGAVAGGLWLTRQNKATLRRLGGGGGAFTIDTLPATAGQNLPWWDRNTGGQVPDWDIIP